MTEGIRIAFSYLSRRNFQRIPQPDGVLKMKPVWFGDAMREWEKSRNAS